MVLLLSLSSVSSVSLLPAVGRSAVASCCWKGEDEVGKGPQAGKEGGRSNGGQACGQGKGRSVTKSPRSRPRVAKPNWASNYHVQRPGLRGALTPRTH